MLKNKLFPRIKYLKHLDKNTVLQAAFGIGVIACSFISCSLNFSPAALFSSFKDVFRTVMVFVGFFAAVNQLEKHYQAKIDKLDYLDHWQDNSSEIYQCNDFSLYERQLLYGVQAATYTYGETEKLYKRVEEALADKLYSKEETKSLLECVQSILEVFYKTSRLTKNLCKKDFEVVRQKLQTPYEEQINDADLAAWCKILRNDKLELALEMYAPTLAAGDKINALNEAIQMCKDCITLLEEQVSRNKHDKYFALLYRAYINRNISQIYKELYNMTSEPEYQEKEKAALKATFENRQELYNHYRFHRKANSVTSDYITQEYILALTEQYEFELSSDVRDEYFVEMKTEFDQWKQQNDIRNMLYDKINQRVMEISEERSVLSSK